MTFSWVLEGRRIEPEACSKVERGTGMVLVRGKKGGRGLPMKSQQDEIWLSLVFNDRSACPPFRRFGGNC